MSAGRSPVIFANLFPDADDRGARRSARRDARRHLRARRRAARAALSATSPRRCTTLHAAGYTLAVASNGRTRYVETVLATYGLADLFIPRVTADDGRRQDRRSCATTCYRWPSIRDAVVMVGDRASDVDAARAVGCRFIGCDYGHGYRHEIEHAGPLVRDFAALPGVIASLLA